VLQQKVPVIVGLKIIFDKGSGAEIMGFLLRRFPKPAIEKIKENHSSV